MNYNNPRHQQTAGIVRFSCSLLFLLFSFCYLFFMQGELLAEAQYVFSEGLTHYNILVGAIISPIVLQVVQMLVAWIVRLPSRFHALSYFPSFLALAVLTDLSRERLAEESFAPWTWWIPILLVVWILLVFVLRQWERYGSLAEASKDFGAILWPNYLVLFAMILFCGLTNRADDVFLYELKAERLILEQRYEEAAQVAINADATSPRLNNLRHFALAKMGHENLPERMFLYPQPYGVEGLLVLSDTTSHLERLTVTDITARLGAHTDALDMPVERFLQKALHLQQAHLDSLLAVDSLYLANANDSIRHQHAGAVGTLRRHVRTTADYRLCALLLKKDLPQFVAEIPEFYPQVEDTLDEVRASLPLAYRQALAIMAPQLTDSTTLHQYYDYAAMLDTLSTPRSRRNLSLYEHGRNYWWYFEFQPLP